MAIISDDASSEIKVEQTDKLSDLLSKDKKKIFYLFKIRLMRYMYV